ncbi:MAG: DUF1460 domain-containing protein [Acidobacteria bacterium]|nr:DUF1460 domain-containing protein [Acidobacteriota bacterium]
MKARSQIYPQDFNPASAEGTLDQVRNVYSAGERMNIISGHFIGYPYMMNPLIGSLNVPEVFTASLEGFDCVTYIETVLALALAGSVDQFVEIIRQIRYENGQVDWKSRDHYMTDWIKNNVRQGFVRNITRGNDTASRTRTLSMIEELPPRTVTFKCFPKRVFPRIKHRIADGDLIFFASTRKRLDVFHAGLLFREGEQINLRHASHSQGGVVVQPLTEFLKQNRMAGLILVRPTEKPLAAKQLKP